jgi:hypothetical protein
MARARPLRINRERILVALREASRTGDRHALTLAIDEMRTLALSPRYWEKYLVLLKNPLARLVDLLVIKQGNRIAHQKGWKLRRPAGDDGGPPPSPARKSPARRRGARRGRAGERATTPAASQPSLF